ncbi:Kinesin member, variant 2, partial [Perkinsus olseni]
MAGRIPRLISGPIRRTQQMLRRRGDLGESPQPCNLPHDGFCSQVGDEVKEGMGFSVGLVVGNGAPPSTTPISDEDSGGTDGVREKSKSPQAAPSRQAAFAAFKQEHGRRYDDRHRDLATRAKEIRAEIRMVAGSVNSAVDEIERM